jgi:hypothetical protein
MFTIQKFGFVFKKTNKEQNVGWTPKVPISIFINDSFIRRFLILTAKKNWYRFCFLVNLVTILICIMLAEKLCSKLVMKSSNNKKQYVVDSNFIFRNYTKKLFYFFCCLKSFWKFSNGNIESNFFFFQFIYDFRFNRSKKLGWTT